MVKDVAIYFEGGGENRSTRDPLRLGLSEFLRDLRKRVREQRGKWRIIPCGGRQEAYNAFCDALENEPAMHNVLLVDSETAPLDFEDPWTHLKSRQGDEWDQPDGADRTRCFLMVVTMESWLFTDTASAKKHFGKNFDDTALPKPEYVETTSKPALNAAIAKAMKSCNRTYKKIEDGSALLQKVEATFVRKHSASCDRLFKLLLDRGKK